MGTKNYNVLSANSRRRNKFLDFILKYKYVHLIALPCVVYYIVFKYLPMYGIVIAFKNYRGTGGFMGILNADWVGFLHFKNLFTSIYFFRLLRNTFLISLYRLVFAFPAPIILAVMISEVTRTKFKKTVQTITYMPHFLSWVVVAGLVTSFLSPEGPLNILLKRMGIEPIFFLSEAKYFRSILVISDIWKSVGWGTIIYLAAITGVNPEIYEAGIIDGMNKIQKIVYITLPTIKEVVAIMFILATGRILDENFEQIFNLYNETVYEVADVFETYVYRAGILRLQFSYTAAVGLFKSVVGLILVFISNMVAKRLGSEGLW